MTTQELAAEKTIIVTKQGNLTRIKLNRPHALNAINLEMVGLIKKAVGEAQNDGTEIIVIEGTGNRGLSGGGDIKLMAHNGAEHGYAFIKNEYEMNLLLAESTVPTIGIMSGITMGGGIGVSGHNTLRIVTETSRLAMPEVKIGIVPDVGGHLLLAKNSPGYGDYLALTAESMTAADAIALNFADHMIRESEIENFLAKLASKKHTPLEIFDEARNFSEPAGPSPLLENKAWVPEMFEIAHTEAGDVTLETASAEEPEALAEWALTKLKTVLKIAEASKSDGVREFASTVRQMNPVSLAITLAQLERTRVLNLDLKSVLEDDLRILTRLFRLPNFVEGVRALAIDKDQNPKWQPARVDELQVSQIAELLSL